MSLVPVAVVESWLAHRASSIEALRWFCDSRGTVVVEERGWTVAQDRLEVFERITASVFYVRGRSVVGYKRFEHLANALAVAGLTPDSEILTPVPSELLDDEPTAPLADGEPTDIGAAAEAARKASRDSAEAWQYLDVPVRALDVAVA
jgi:hypothetical protein